MFEQAKDLHSSGKSFVAIAAEIGVGYRTIAKWVEADGLPHRRRLTLKPSSPLYFQDFLARRSGRRRQGRPSTVSRHPASRLHGQPFPQGDSVKSGEHPDGAISVVLELLNGSRKRRRDEFQDFARAA